MGYNNRKATSWLATLLSLRVAHDMETFSFCAATSMQEDYNVFSDLYPTAVKSDVIDFHLMT